MDFYPTLAKIAGAILSEDNISDGNDIRLLLENPDTGYLTERPFYYYARNGNIEAMRLGKWKLHIKKSIGWNVKKEGDFELALYDLDSDISESKNVAADFPDVVKKLTQKLLDFDSSLNK